MRILLVDDDASIRRSLESVLHERHTVHACADGTEALEQLKQKSFDLVLSDNQMPGITGFELLKKTRELSPSTAFVLMTAFGSMEQSIEAVKLGADDYLMKPFNLADVEHRVQRIDDLRVWAAENEIKLEEGTGIHRLVGKSKAILEAKKFSTQVAAVDSPVLILGPTGTGKELLARAIHESGPRSLRPFIPVNCASLSENLMESELFGHEKGAFTGAQAAKPGKFELAKGGTLFLDELGELSLGLQAKLLRVMQEREFFRVGGTRQIQSDARVVAATNRSLKEMVSEGEFREDLYFRFNVLTFSLAPLCERRDDIPLLVNFILDSLAHRLGRKVKLADDVLPALARYSFPGNIRELHNLLERLVVLCPRDSVVRLEMLPEEVKGKGRASGKKGLSLPAGGLNEALEKVEFELIEQAMKATGHNQAKAAKLLKIERTALRYKLKKYGYESPFQAVKDRLISDSDDEAA